MYILYCLVHKPAFMDIARESWIAPTGDLDHRLRGTLACYALLCGGH
jgi:hypothetical protein